MNGENDLIALARCQHRAVHSPRFSLDAIDWLPNARFLLPGNGFLSSFTTNRLPSGYVGPTTVRLYVSAMECRSLRCQIANAGKLLQFNRFS